MMRNRWVLSAVAVAVTAAAGGVAVALSTARSATSAGQAPAVNTAAVERGTLSDQISQAGTLTYRGRPDGSPYTVFNRARGTYTALPNSGDRVGCGGVLYRVNNKPVLLMCGSTPVYRSLSEGTYGPDVT